jgi:hypothetical protein
MSHHEQLKIPEEVQDLFSADKRVHTVVEYLDGFVPNAYKYRAPGTRRVWSRDGSFVDEVYDRKRSHGSGPRLVARSSKGGTLTSK